MADSGNSEFLSCDGCRELGGNRERSLLRLPTAPGNQNKLSAPLEADAGVLRVRTRLSICCSVVPGLAASSLTE